MKGLCCGVFAASERNGRNGRVVEFVDVGCGFGGLLGEEGLEGNRDAC